MKLVTKELRKQFPPIYANEEKDPTQIRIVAKFFTPWTNWTWYATEFDGEDTFFGLVDGQERELGYFSLRELEALKGPFGLKIERDLYYGPHMLAEVI